MKRVPMDLPTVRQAQAGRDNFHLTKTRNYKQMKFIIKRFNIVFIILILFSSVLISQSQSGTEIKRTYYPKRKY